MSLNSNTPALPTSNFIWRLWQGNGLVAGINLTISQAPEVSTKFPVNVPPPPPENDCFPSIAYLKGVVSAPSDLYVT